MLRKRSQRSLYDRGVPDEANALPNRTAYFSFAIVAVALLMASVDTTIVAVSLRTILADMRTNLAWVGWTITGYTFSQSIIMPLAGKLSDDWGRKRLFLAAVVIFTFSSLAAGLSPNIYWLVFFRIIQGIGAGIFFPSATGIVSDAFGKRRAPAIGLFASIFPIGGILGPNIGGFIIDHYSWHWIFFVNIPVGVVLLLFGWIILPKSTTISAKHSFDVAGAALFSSAILILLYATTTWAEHSGAFGAITGFLFATGGILLYLFIRHEGKVQQPMIELKLLRWRPLLAINIYNFFFGAVVFGVFSFIPYYAAIAYGMTAGETGLLLTPRALSMIVVSALTSLFIVRLNYRLPMLVGLITMSLSLLLLSQGYHDLSIFGIGLHNLVILTLLVSLQGIGVGIANPASNNAGIDLIPGKTATIMGLRGMFRSMGGVFGTAGFVFALSCYSDKVLGLQHIFRYMAILLMLLIPIVFIIPNTARKSKDS